MTAGRPVGNHIRNICATLEAIGPAGARELLTHHPALDPSNMGRYCSRAVGLGMMTRTPAIRGKVKYSIFAVVADWREIAGQRRTTKLRPMPVPMPVKSDWLGVNSVFSVVAI